MEVDDLVSAVLSAQLADITQAERWFALVCRTYEGSVSAGEEGWDGFRERLIGAAAGEGFPAEAEKLTEYMAATSAPLSVIASMNEQGEHRLAEMYLAEMAVARGDEGTVLEQGQVADDPAAWNAYLAANGPVWDGAEGAWQQFRDWFLYYAAEAGVKQSAQGFVDYVEAQQDKVAAFAQYGIVAAAQPSADDSAESAGAVDSSSFPELSEGDSGEWVDYLDSMLRSRGF
jgi:hypothetical protein